MALHPCADHAHLAEVVPRAPLDAEAVEHGGRRSAVVGRRREDDLGPGADDRVDVHSLGGERREQARRGRALHAVERLLARVRDSGDERLLEHAFVLLANPRSVRGRERRAHVQLDVVVAGDFD